MGLQVEDTVNFVSEIHGEQEEAISHLQIHEHNIKVGVLLEFAHCRPTVLGNDHLVSVLLKPL